MDLLSLVGVITFQAILLGRYDPAALAAEGIVLQFLVIGFIIFTIFIMGGTILISRRLGAGKDNQAHVVFTQSMLLALILSLVVIMIGLWIGPFIFRDFIGVPDDVLVHSLDLLWSLFPFLPFIALTFTGTGLIRGSGNTFISMVISLIANSVNAVLAIGLIYGRWGMPEMGIKGMGFAMGIGNMLGFLLILAAVLSGMTRVRIHIRSLRRLSTGLLLTMLRLGYPVTVEQLLWTLALFVMNIWAARLGTIPLTFHQVVLQILELISVMYQGIGFANMSMLGEAIGNHDSKLEWRIHRHTRSVMLAGAVVTGLALFVFARPLMALFLPDIEDLSQGINVLRLFAFLQIPRAIVLTTSYHLRARGDVKWMLFTTGLLALIFEVTLAYVFGLVFGLGLFGIWLVVGLDESTKAVWHYIRLKRNRIHHF